MPGIDTSAVEVTHISANGIWILIDDEEFALPYAEFPWLRNATVDQILTVERPTADHRLTTIILADRRQNSWRVCAGGASIPLR